MIRNYFEEHIAPHLSATLTSKEIKLLSSRLDKPCDFLERYIKSQAYLPQRDLHMCVTRNYKIEARSPRDNPISQDDAEWFLTTYFSNTMFFDDSVAPSLRVKLGTHYIFTYEYDVECLSFFKEQLSWFKGVRDPSKDSLFARLDQQIASMFSDYAGSCAVWSGNKSVHMHFAFRTDILQTYNATSLRDGLNKTWYTLQPTIEAALNIPKQYVHKLDKQLRLPEQLRRIPNGMRYGLSENNIFNAPSALDLPQAVLFDRLRERSLGQKSIFDIVDFQHVETQRAKPVGSKTQNKNVYLPNSPELDYCADRMNEIFTNWPKFAGFGEQSGETVAYFANSEHDANPASIMKADYASVMVNGTPPVGNPIIPKLTRPLGEMLDLWVAEYNRPFMNPAGRKRSALEQQFADAAVDKDAARLAISKVITDMITSGNEANLLVAPEGISKSTSLFENTPRLFQELDAAGQESFMFAFATYAMAQEKCDQFNEIWQDTKAFGQHHAGIVVKSFSRVYQEACAALNLKQIDLAMAAQMGEPSLNAAIQNRQPEVWQAINLHFKNLRQQVRGKNPVLFCVHDVAHDWFKSSLTRLMLSPAFWNETLDEKTRRIKAREGTRLALLVHDEVSVDNLLLMAPAEHREWVERLSLAKDEDGKKLWPSSGSATRLLNGYEAYVQLDQPPAEMTFEAAVAITEAKKFDTVTLTTNHEYGLPDASNEDIYDVNGRVWTVHAKEWTQAARSTLVLTTEALPTAVIKNIGGWNVTELDCPNIAKSVFEVRASRSVISKNLDKCVLDARANHTAGRTLYAIGNKIAHLVDSNTHHSAKGSNAYIGQDIVQLISPFPPAAVEKLEAINAWLDTDIAVRLAHVDQFNQTAGRNLGFRATDPEPAHILLINDRIWTQLAPVIQHMRYKPNVVQTRRTKEKLKKAATKLTGPLNGNEKLAYARRVLIKKKVA